MIKSLNYRRKMSRMRFVYLVNVIGTMEHKGKTLFRSP